MSIRKSWWAVATILAIGPAAHAWGPEGHQITALVAEHYLDEYPRQQVHAILGSQSLADVAVWGDEVRRHRPWTAHWHYVNLPENDATFVPDRDCPSGDCVIGAVERFYEMLGNSFPVTPGTDTREGLMFLVHFVGDLHQPMHVGYAADRGGNDIHLTFFGQPANLHEIWDELMIERQHVAAEQYARELIADITEADKAEWMKLSGETHGLGQWVSETRLLAQRAYCRVDGPRLKTGDHIGRTYVDAMMPMVDRQLAKGGYRLACLLNLALADYRKEADQRAKARAEAWSELIERTRRSSTQPATQPLN